MTTEGLRIDHVIYGVRDLEAGARRLWDEYGLRAPFGGTHPGGTKNLSAFFSDQTYIELLAVNDPALPMGAWLSGLIETGDKLVGWAVGSDDVDAVAERIGQEVISGSIELPDGTTSGWRYTGLSMDPGRPFFIQYDRSPEAEARMQETAASPEARHRIEARGIAWVEVAGDREAMTSWLGVAELDVRFVDGEPGVRSVGIATADGEIVIR